MGTDIHLQVQGQRADGTWEYVRRSPFPPFRSAEYGTAPDPTRRSYALFARLAGVRNGHGFAGVPTHVPVAPVLDFRGLPDGLSEDDVEYRDGHDFFGGDDWLGDHSFTWATLAELQAADFDVPFHYYDGPVERPLADCGFVKWVHGDTMRAFAEEYGGPERVRVLIGFDS